MTNAEPANISYYESGDKPAGTVAVTAPIVPSASIISIEVPIDCVEWLKRAVQAAQQRHCLVNEYQAGNDIVRQCDDWNDIVSRNT